MKFVNYRSASAHIKCCKSDDVASSWLRIPLPDTNHVIGGNSSWEHGMGQHAVQMKVTTTTSSRPNHGQRQGCMSAIGPTGSF